MVGAISTDRLPQLSTPQKSDTMSISSYPPLRNRLADQNKRSMNATYTSGMPLTTQIHSNRQRSCSIDSDVAEYSIHNAIAGVIHRHAANAFSKSFKAHAKHVTNATMASRLYSSKLPSLEGFSGEKTCCQRPFGRAQLELQKFKDTLKKMSP